MPIISVVVPIYNAQIYLARCVESLLCQTMSDFELILVNDGSKDDSGLLCDQYAQKDLRIRVLHQTNQGLSCARNRGTELATGRYITYIDSDDYVDSHYLEVLWQSLCETGADCAAARLDRVRENEENMQRGKEWRVSCWTQKEALSEILTSRNITVSAACKLAPREWYLEAPFLEGTFYEDLSNTYKIFQKAEKVAYVDATLYHYVMRAGSITGRNLTTVKQCTDYANAIELCTANIIAQYPELAPDAAVLKARDYMALYLMIQRCKEQPVEIKQLELQVLNWMRSNWMVAAKNSNAPLSVRLRVLLMGLWPGLYQKLYYIGIRFKGKQLG